MGEGTVVVLIEKQELLPVLSMPAEHNHVAPVNAQFTGKHIDHQVVRLFHHPEEF